MHAFSCAKHDRLTLQDFGLARVLLTAATAVTACGSFDWAAPELLMGGTSSKVSSAADIYRCALAAVRLLSLCCGKVLWLQSMPLHMHAPLSSYWTYTHVWPAAAPTNATCLCVRAQLRGRTLGAGDEGGAVPLVQPSTSASPCLLVAQQNLFGWVRYEVEVCDNVIICQAARELPILHADTLTSMLQAVRDMESLT